MAAPRVFDWDGDGLDDIISGNGAGDVLFVKNLGITMSLWDAPIILEANGSPLRIIPDKAVPGTEEPHCGYTTIDVGDWDGDGLPDILVNEHNGNIVWIKNIGMRDGKMVLQYMGRVISKTLMGHTDGPTVSDFNRDGILDLLVGTETGVLYCWERWNNDITTTMTTDGKQQPAKHKYFKRYRANYQINCIFKINFSRSNPCYTYCKRGTKP